MSGLSVDGDLSGLTVVEDSANLHEDIQKPEESDGSCEDLGSFVPKTIQKRFEI